MGSSGEKKNHHHRHHHQHGHVPKGCMAVMVGQGREQQRFVIPVIYVNHPLFLQLLKEAEEEYGFDHNGPINIPCHVDDFRQVVQGIIRQQQDTITTTSQHHHHGHHLPSACFKIRA